VERKKGRNQLKRERRKKGEVGFRILGGIKPSARGAVTLALRTGEAKRGGLEKSAKPVVGIEKSESQK